MNYIEKFVRALKEKEYTVSFAESCTGGMLSASIVDISGVSSVFGFGFVTYSAEAKMSILEVSKETLEKHGIVSCETAREMALGAAKKSKSNIAIATTGCAGPGKDSEGNEPGTICFGFFINGNVIAEKVRIDGNTRNEIRINATEYAYERICYLLSL